MNGWQDRDHFLGSIDVLRNRMNRIFNDLDRSDWQTSGQLADNFPRTNLYEMDNHFALLAEVPGLTKDDLNIKIQGNYLEISGKLTNENPAGYTAQRLERQDTSFSRSFTMPVDIDQEKVEATLRDGILTLTMPKAESAKPRQISIR